MKRWDAILRRLPTDKPLLGVEIGVLRGLTSRNLLENRPLLTLYMVDPWSEVKPGNRYYDSGDLNAIKTQKEHDRDHLTASRVVEPYGKRAIIQWTTSKIATLTTNDQLDFVFIDGDHSREGVAEDIELWTPKIKKGGWIGGHDYDHPNFPGVKAAVDATFPEGVETDSERTWFKRLGKP